MLTFLVTIIDFCKGTSVCQHPFESFFVVNILAFIGNHAFFVSDIIGIATKYFFSSHQNTPYFNIEEQSIVGSHCLVLSLVRGFLYSIST